LLQSPISERESTSLASAFYARKQQNDGQLRSFSVERCAERHGKEM